MGRIRCNRYSIEGRRRSCSQTKTKQSQANNQTNPIANPNNTPIEKMKTDDTLASTCDNVYDIAGGRKTTTTADMETGGGGGKDEMAVLVSVGQDDVVAFAYENESVPSLESEDDEDDDEEEEDEDWESDDDEEEDEEGEFNVDASLRR